jgi:hypothetical protein
MTKRVKAKETGFYGGSLRYPGQVFELADGDVLGSWMEPTEAAAPVPKPKKPKTGPETLSELTPSLAADLV